MCASETVKKTADHAAITATGSEPPAFILRQLAEIKPLHPETATCICDLGFPARLFDDVVWNRRVDEIDSCVRFRISGLFQLDSQRIPLSR